MGWSRVPPSSRRLRSFRRGDVVDNLPPHDTEAEEAVLGSALAGGDAMVRMSGIVQATDFFREKNAWVWEACVELFQGHEAVNQITVGHSLARSGKLEEVGGMSYLSALVAQLPTPLGCESYARIVARDAAYRRLLGASQGIQQMAYEGGDDLDGALVRAEMLLRQARPREQRHGWHIRELLDQMLEEQVEGEPLAKREWNTGFPKLEGLVAPIKDTAYVLLGGRPSLGKTSLALQLARNAAVGQGRRVLFLSGESSPSELARRLLACEAKVNTTRVRLGTHSEQEERQIMRAVGTLANTNIIMEMTSKMAVQEVASFVRRIDLDGHIGLVVIDYVQLLNSGLEIRASENEKLTVVSQTLKNLAGEVQVPILAVSQLSRASEQRAERKPKLADLRGSGTLEQDGDLIMFLHRPKPQRADLVELEVAKNKDGPTGSITMTFYPHWTRFEEGL